MAALNAYIHARRIELGDELEAVISSSTSTKTKDKGGDDEEVLTCKALQPLVYWLIKSSRSAWKYDHAIGIALIAVYQLLHQPHKVANVLKILLVSSIEDEV